MIDLLLTIVFLCNWVFVVMPHRTIPNFDKLVDRMTGKTGLAFVNADSPMTLASAAGLAAMSIGSSE